MNTWIKELYIRSTTDEINKLCVHFGFTTKQWRTGSRGLARHLYPPVYEVQEFVNEMPSMHR